MQKLDGGGRRKMFFDVLRAQNDRLFHSDLRISEGRMRHAFTAGTRPASRESRGVMRKINCNALALSVLGKEFPKNAALNASWPWRKLSRCTMASICLSVKTAALAPIRQLMIPKTTPHVPKIHAMLFVEAPMACNMPISRFLSLTSRVRSEMILQQATRRMMAATREKRYLSLWNCCRRSLAKSYSLNVVTFQ